MRWKRTAVQMYFFQILLKNIKTDNDHTKTSYVIYQACLLTTLVHSINVSSFYILGIGVTHN